MSQLGKVTENDPKTVRKRIVVGITGASGSVYAQRLVEKLVAIEPALGEVAIVFSDAGRKVWEYELGAPFPQHELLHEYPINNLFAPPASGSANYEAMVVVPCTVGTLGRIAHGVSGDLLTRSADVMLKERKPLVLVLRELPYSLIHIENMRTLTLAGGIVVPASPSFYSRPQSISQLVDTVIDRVLGLLGFGGGGFVWEGS